MITGIADEHLIQGFAGAQRTGIGYFTADPATAQWTWTDAIYRIFGREPESVAPTWSFILDHIPDDERPVIETAWQQAQACLGPFSWSHRVHAADGLTRSILVVGHTTTPPPHGPITTEPQPVQSTHSCLTMSGFVVDLTELRSEGARSAGTDAVHASATHRAPIEQAKGALMLAYGIEPDAAFALLAWHSQHSNRKLHLVAADLLDRLRTHSATNSNLRNAMDSVLQSPHRSKPTRKNKPA